MQCSIPVDEIFIKNLNKYITTLKSLKQVSQILNKDKPKITYTLSSAAPDKHFQALLQKHRPSLSPPVRASLHQLFLSSRIVSALSGTARARSRVSAQKLGGAVHCLSARVETMSPWSAKKAVPLARPTRVADVTSSRQSPARRVGGLAGEGLAR